MCPDSRRDHATKSATQYQEFCGNATFQFYRTGRWLGRLEAICCGRFTPAGPSDTLLDYFIAFFLNCHHIKDWLATWPEWHESFPPGPKKKAIEQFINESEALRICADLCNGFKHFESKAHSLRSGVAPTFHSLHTVFDLTEDEPLTTRRYTLRTTRGETDAYELAKECVDAWRTFIRESTTESLQNLAARNDAERAARKTAKSSLKAHAPCQPNRI